MSRLCPIFARHVACFVDLMVHTARTSRSLSPSLLATGMITPEGLSDSELLSELLGQPLARSLHLLESAGGVSRLREPRIGQLIARGWPPKAAARVLAARELNRRAERGLRDSRARCIATPSDVYSWAESRLASLEREELWVLALNARNHLLAARVVAVGGSSGVRTTTGDVLRTALGEGASAFVQGTGTALQTWRQP